MPEKKIRVRTLTANIVPKIDEVAAKGTVDRLMGGISSFIRQCISEGDLTSAVVIFSTAEGKAVASVFDTELGQEPNVESVVLSQTDQIAVSNLANTVATTLVQEAIQKTRAFVNTSE